MLNQLRMQDVRRAWQAQDPAVVDLVARLSRQDEDWEEQVRDGAFTFEDFLREIRSYRFVRKTSEEQQQYRVETFAALEADDAEAPLPERVRLHEIILELWQDCNLSSSQSADTGEQHSLHSRDWLLNIIASVHLTYGPWKALKQIFKEAEARNDTEIFGALAARFDMAYAGGDYDDVRRETLGYLCRRAWRYLRRTGETLGACFADYAVDVLAQYTNETNWRGTWIANHLFYHETGGYTATQFRFYRVPSSLLKHRAFADLWKRTPRPLFSLLERAKAEQIRRFAVDALKTDFRATLREVEADWVARLVYVGSSTVDEFVIWILDNVPKFEQAAFRDLGLHEAVLHLFDSPAGKARLYAADYARTHARDLSVDQLIRLANNSQQAVRKLATDLLGSRDPRKEVGLDAWGRLLETDHGHEQATAVLRKHFGAKELSPDWFKARLLAENRHAFEFAKQHLSQVHPTKKLGADFFRELIDEIDETVVSRAGVRNTVNFGLEELAKFDVNELETEFFKRLIVRPLTTRQACRWLDEGRLKVESLPVDFFKLLAFEPAWNESDWVNDLRQSDHAWARRLTFDETLADNVIGWLKDVRRFSPEDLGFDWLMQLVSRSEPRYHDFAVEVMIKAFLPADFAPQDEQAVAEETMSDDDEINIDFEGATFVFTGKLATMQRKEAQDKVLKANGANASTINAKLNYLVIGDEGSPLYGGGRKGSKQLKAESLNEKGAEIKVISETAFLQMLAGEQREFSEDAVQAGCERLWEMATKLGEDGSGKGDEPLAKFAFKYLRMHHPEICLAETDRPVDPGAEIPDEFLTFDRVKPLYFDRRKPLRDYALELARWELNRWSPPIEGLIEMCESPYGEVRQFVAKALLADDSPEHKRYRIDPDILTADAVYSFCESRDEGTRALGMQLIDRHPRLRLPEELFRLTESPDRKVRAFVVRSLWSLYRSRGITTGWKPNVPPQATIGASAKKKAETAEQNRGDGAPDKPKNPPADYDSLRGFLRRMLFEIPPAKLEKTKQVEQKLKPLPARKAKLLLIETLRDLALEDREFNVPARRSSPKQHEFADVVLPLLEEFMASRGQSERAACLVAVTRIRSLVRD